MNARKFCHIFGLIIGLLGLGIVVYVHWPIAFGTFLMFWGDNILRDLNKNFPCEVTNNKGS